MSNRVDSFLGDTPIRTIIKLAVISFVVGVILSVLNITPFEVWDSIKRFVVNLYELGFDALSRIAVYFIYGALVVVPIFLVLRLMKMGRTE